TRRTTDPREGDDLFVIEIAFLEHFVERSQNRKVSTTWAPSGMVGGDCFLAEFFSLWNRSCCFRHKRFFNQEARNPGSSVTLHPDLNVCFCPLDPGILGFMVS